ncbi:Calcium uptake protein 3, mitochondrial EF-hand domain-containing family member A2 [Collichthys lucidus]|uniref:Calcium uptake protein 3, mitochondrial EF-hand domain-containing family member A2 n=1 Tax=Collichthys lucidus TaxID=240159 RepID=A0A4U5UDF3_COLLU|nr:Calcium uptake protein 3, mitochondrial EF-hand domain-containing family member A2 [Collichthys lucidus]
MAALRRLIHSLANSSRKGTWRQPTPSKALKVIAAGACVTAAAGAAYYGCSSVGRRSGLRSHVEARLFHLALPSVSATEKVRTFGLDDGDVYMSSYENRFRLFSSVECEGQLYMTPLNFIESITLNEPKSAISYTEYLFLLCILTKPHAGFRIAFNMFDADGNEMVDKREFLVLEEIFRKKKDKKEVAEDVQRFDQQLCFNCCHRFLKKTVRMQRPGACGMFSDVAQVKFCFLISPRFMDNLQTEVLEIEFLSYSKGLPTISEEDFARILLRYTNVDDVSGYLENVRHGIPDEKGITFEEFRSFFQFLNNLEDFTIAMQMYNFAARSVGQEEFTRAVYVATGIKLTRHLVNTVFKIFDEDRDDKLSHKEFIGVMKDRLQRGDGGVRVEEKFTSFKSCMKKELSGK